MKKIIILQLLLQCFVFIASAQLNKIDSLKNLLIDANEDSSLMRLHFLIAQIYFKNGISDSQLVHAESAIIIADRMQDMNVDQKKIKAGALRLKGIYYRLNGEFEKAIPFYINALKEFEAINDSNGIASTLNSIGIAYLNLKRFEEAYVYFSNANEMDSLLHRPAKQAADLTNMVNALHRNGNMPDTVNIKAYHLSLRALELSRQYGDTALLISSNETVAMMLRDLHRSSESLPYQLQALSLAQYLALPALLAEQQYQLADIYNDLKEFDMAIYYGQLSEALATQNNLAVHKFDIYGVLSTAFSGAKNFEQAFGYSQKLNILLDSTYQTEIAEQLKRFESEAKDNKIQLLNSENEIAYSKLQQNKILLAAAAISILLLFALLYALYKNREAKIKNISTLQLLNEELKKQKTEITRMNTVLELKALRAQMNPHFIFNCMSSIQECMLTNRLDDANNYLTKLSKLLRMVLIHADDESVSLEKELEMLTLYLNLESLRLKERFSYNIYVDEELATEEVQVPTLILQPFVENAIWHGLVNKTGERNIAITISADQETLHCTIEDNGIGRVKAQQLKSISSKHKSRGLHLIEKRLQILREREMKSNARFSFTDLANAENESTGTRVNIYLPVTAA